MGHAAFSATPVFLDNFYGELARNVVRTFSLVDVPDIRLDGVAF